MYAPSLNCNSLNVSLGDQSSMTKSGQIGAKTSCCSGVKASQRLRRIQDPSGDREAPFGRVKPVLESNTTPRLSFLAQFASWRLISAFNMPVLEFVGDMTTISFW